MEISESFRETAVKFPTSRKEREIWGTRVGGREKFLKACSHADSRMSRKHL
jgi:hypothetical protein